MILVFCLIVFLNSWILHINYDYDYAPHAVKTVTSKWKRARRRKHPCVMHMVSLLTLVHTTAHPHTMQMQHCQHPLTNTAQTWREHASNMEWHMRPHCGGRLVLDLL